MLIRETPSTSANKSHNISSFGFLATLSLFIPLKSGAGNFFLSTLPFGVNGNTSSTTNVDGII